VKDTSPIPRSTCQDRHRLAPPIDHVRDAQDSRSSFFRDIHRATGRVRTTLGLKCDSTGPARGSPQPPRTARIRYRHRPAAPPVSLDLNQRISTPAFLVFVWDVSCDCPATAAHLSDHFIHGDHIISQDEPTIGLRPMRYEGEFPATTGLSTPARPATVLGLADSPLGVLPLDHQLLR